MSKPALAKRLKKTFSNSRIFNTLPCRMTLPKTISGAVMVGAGLARRFGYPTANLDVGALNLDEGIYLGRASYEKTKDAPSVIFYGLPHALPAIKKPRFEVHLLDTTADLYNKILTVRPEKFLRPNQKFATNDELQQAITSDFAAARAYFSPP